MKKVKSVTVSIVFCAIAAAFLAAAIIVLPRRLAFCGGESYTFFVGNTSKSCRVVTSSPSSAPFVRLALKDVCGESATYSSLDLENFLNKVDGEILFVEELEDSVNYYCSADLPYSVELYGQTVNLHVCVKQDSITVASPIIFGGY